MSRNGMQVEPNTDALKTVFAEAFNRLDRLPALHGALERTAALCADGLRDAANPAPELALTQVETGIAAASVAHCEGASVVAVLNAVQWGARLLITADRVAVFTLVEMLLGADGTRDAYDANRGFSKIELRIVQQFFSQMAAALETAFSAIANSSFVVEGVSDRIDFDAIGRRDSAVVVARLKLCVWGREGELLIVIPKIAIDPMRQAFARTITSDTSRIDHSWSAQIRDEITRTSVTLWAVLDERPLTLGEIANLTAGQIIQLNATPQTRVRVECNGEPLLWCELGKANGAYTLRVEAPIDRDQEFINDILAG